jgi:hypothetical protein
MSAKYQRTRLWVDPPFQSRLLFWVGLYLLVYSLLVLHLGFFFETVQVVCGGNRLKTFSDLYVDHLRKQWPLLISFVLTTPVVLYDVLKFSHRVAGPLYRCGRVMRAMAAGQAVPEFKARKRDLMRDFFESFNTLIRAWNVRTDKPVTEPKLPADGITAQAPGHAVAAAP